MIERSVESQAEELLECRAIESFDKAVRLGVSHLTESMLDVIQGKKQLIGGNPPCPLSSL